MAPGGEKRGPGSEKKRSSREEERPVKVTFRGKDGVSEKEQDGGTSHQKSSIEASKREPKSCREWYVGDPLTPTGKGIVATMNPE